MSRNNFNHLKFESDHLHEEQLLMFVDGELSAKDAVRAREHLETCWTCRGDLEKIEETISLFVEFRKKVQIPFSPAPPNNWNNFNGLIREAGREAAKRRRSWFDFSSLSPFQLRIGIASFTVVLITALFLQLVTVPNVSASELLEKATAAHSEELKYVPQPVRYQKLRVRSENSQLIEWEVWHDTLNSRSKQVIQGEQPKESIETLQSLVEILQKNKLDPQAPLSPGSFKTWHDSLSDKTDQITENDSISLTTTINGNIIAGQITEATVKFRRHDLHPFEQTLKVKTDSGHKTFEVSEVDFEVISQSTLRPNFFDETSASSTVVKFEKAATQSPESSPENAKVISPDTEIAATAFATAELEVEVFQLLNAAKADLGEEIVVKRENGVLYVRGLVETRERKNEILTALQPVRQDPAVRIELQTAAEAVANSKNQPTSKPFSVESLETKTLTTAAQNDLVEKLGSEAEARNFATRTVNRSSQAMSHVYAMRRLSRQFSPAEIRDLSPAAKAKWLGLIASHARNFKTENETLSRELGSVFGVASIAGSSTFEVNGTEDLTNAIERLFAIASNNDRMIRSALTISADDRKMSALRSAQFWQSLKNAENLAGRIAVVK